MFVCINGMKQEVHQPCTLENLISIHQLESQWCAVALNGEFIPKDEYTNTQLSDGDSVEILQPAQGG